MVQGPNQGTVRVKCVSLDGIKFDLRVDRTGSSCVVTTVATETRPGEHNGKSDGCTLYIHGPNEV